MYQRSLLRTLVVFPGALGDFVCLLPALRAIGARHCEPPLLFCKAELIPLVHAAALAAAEPIEGRRASWLFSEEPSAEADAFYESFAGIESWSGFGVPEVARNLTRWCASSGRVHRFRPDPPEHLARHFLRCVSSGREGDEMPDVRVLIDEGVAGAGRARLSTLARPLLVVHPGSGGRLKRWSRAGFLDIAAQWRARGGEAVLLAGPAEDDRAHDERDLSVLRLDLVSAAAVLAASDAYLGNDSGISHLAGAVGARGVALFGPTDPHLWRPLSRGIASLRLSPWSAEDDRAPLDAVAHVERALRQAVDNPGPRL